MFDLLKLFFGLAQQPTVRWTFGPVINLTIARSPIIFQLQDAQKASVSVEFLSAGGNPAKVDGKPTWTVSDANLLDLTISEDGMTATVAAKGPLGTAQLNLTADADLGEGVTNITGQADVQIVAGQAAVVNIKFGSPEPK